MDNSADRIRRQQRAEIARMFGLPPLDGQTARIVATGETGPITDVGFGQQGYGGERRYVQVNGNYYLFDLTFPDNNEVVLVVE